MFYTQRSTRLRALLVSCCVLLSILVAACDGPSIPVPPTPTGLPGAVITSNHQHGEGSGTKAPLFTRYGGPVAVSVQQRPARPVPATPFTITYALKDGAGKPVGEQGLSLTHERLMHLVVVSQDLSYFNHIHPQPDSAGEGSYSVRETVPASGKYLLFNEFVSAAGGTQIERDLFDTAGNPADKPAALTPDLGTTKQSGDLRVTLTSPNPKILRRIPIAFILDVRKDGQPVTDMEPYLAAPCHVVIISADTKQFAHTHGDVPGGPMSGDMGSMDMSKMSSIPVPAHFGPQVQFTHTFMQPGAYRVWLQFGYHGQVQTVAYNIQVVK